MIWNWLRTKPTLIDVGLVAVLLAVGVGAAIHHDGSAGAAALEVIATAPLLWRRRHPVAVLAVVTAAAVSIVAVGYWFAPFPLGLALYTVGSHPGIAAARRVALASIVAITVAVAATGYGEFADSASRLVFLVAAWLLGDSLGSRRAYVLEVEEKALRLEREREAHTRQVAAEEQARIARELHDIVAHALSVVVVQAGAADDVFEVEPARARESIRAIEGAARSALEELRRVLGVLNRGSEQEPQPGLVRIDSLIEQVRGTGLAVSLELEGAPKPLPAAVDLSAYRIVQEALTNTIKHARAEHATVRIRYGADLELEIRDDGRGPANGNGTGRGLIGMRERAAILGGTVEAGGHAEGGFHVAAHLPL
jgi:signal transduction histidine kinase